VDDECQHEGVECELNVDEEGNPECPCPCDGCRIEDVYFGQGLDLADESQRTQAGTTEQEVQ